jgi:hypothetical protein
MENCILDLTLFVSLELIITDMERKDFIQKFAIGGSILLTPPILFSACSDKDDDMDDPGEIRIDLTMPVMRHYKRSEVLSTPEILLLSALGPTRIWHCQRSVPMRDLRLLTTIPATI